MEDPYPVENKEWLGVLMFQKHFVKLQSHKNKAAPFDIISTHCVVTIAKLLYVGLHHHTLTNC